MAPRTLGLLLLLLGAAVAASQPAGAAARLFGNAFLVNGTVPCSAGSAAVGATTPPGFPNADVVLQCGSSAIASTITDSNGGFSLPLPPNPLLTINTLLNNCKMIVDSPLSNCNVSLPSSGTLQSTLKLLPGGGLLGILGGILDVIPGGFHFIP